MSRIQTDVKTMTFLMNNDPMPATLPRTMAEALDLIRVMKAEIIDLNGQVDDLCDQVLTQEDEVEELEAEIARLKAQVPQHPPGFDPAFKAVADLNSAIAALQDSVARVNNPAPLDLEACKRSFVGAFGPTPEDEDRPYAKMFSRWNRNA